jgi:zinc protease
MLRRPAVVVSSLLLLVSCARWAREPRFGSLPRDERTFEFKHNIELVEVSNGLKVALIHDDRTNLATVDVRYAVGAAEDPPGKTGMAHLVEHLVFELRNEPGGPTLGEELGELALYSNAWTSWDYTHYSTQVPIEHLADAIRLEARRMRAPCDQLDQATFERERDVVRNEARERISPATEAMQSILTEVYGKEHPYTRPLTSDDVVSVTREEVCAFIETNYTPDRAYLVITGPYDVTETKRMLGRSFGPIIRTSGGPRMAIGKPVLDGKTTRRTAPVTHPTALVFLSHPAWGADGTVKFLLGRQALAAALSNADDENRWITDTSVYVEGGWRAPVLVARVEVDDEERLEDAASEVFRQGGELLKGVGPTGLSSVIGTMATSYVESWDDLPNRGEWIADFMQYTDHHSFMLKDMHAIFDTNWPIAIQQLRGTMSADRSHVVLLTPGGTGARAKATALPSGSHNLTPWRAPVDPAEADRPVEIEGSLARANIEEYTLANGLIVQLAPDPDSPMIDARLVFPVGRAHEPIDRPYLATAAAKLLRRDYEGYYNAHTYEKLEWSLSHDTEYWSDVDETATTFAVRGLSQWGDWHVWALSWMLDQGRYNAESIQALHDAARARGTDDEDIDPALKVFLARLFGAGHPYATPPPDRSDAFLRIDAADLERWRHDHFRARGATLVISGAFDVTAMKREVDELFGPWSGDEPSFVRGVPKPHPAKGPTWLAVDNEEATQTTILLGFAAASHPQRDEAARAVVAEMIEDSLRDIREGMGASYGVHAAYVGGAAGSALRVTGEVDESKTTLVLTSILASLEAIRAGGDSQRAAFVRARKKVLAQAMGRTGGATAIAAELASNAAARQSVRHGNVVATQISSLRLEDAARIAAADLADEHRVVLLAGKRAAIDAAFSAIDVTPERPVPTDRPKHADEPREPRDEDSTGADARPSTMAKPAPHRPENGPRLSVGVPEGDESSTATGLFLGERKISVDEFLRIAGENEALSSVRSRRWLRQGLFGAAVVGAAASVVIVLTAPGCDNLPTYAQEEQCQRDSSAQKNYAVYTLGAGAILGAIGSQIDSGEPTESELRAIAARYNRVVVAPDVNAKGGGVVISGRF